MKRSIVYDTINLSNILRDLVTEYMTTEIYAKQILLSSEVTDFLVEKSFVGSDLEKEYGIHYLRVPLNLKYIISDTNCLSSIYRCISGKVKGIYIELDIGSFGKLEFDCSYLLLDCNIVSDSMPLSAPVIADFNGLRINIDLSNYNDLFMINSKITTDTYFKFYNKNVKSLLVSENYGVLITSNFSDMESLCRIYNTGCTIIPKNKIDLKLVCTAEDFESMDDISSQLIKPFNSFNSLEIQFITSSFTSPTSTLETTIKSQLNGLRNYFKKLCVSYNYSKTFEYKNECFYIISFDESENESENEQEKYNNNRKVSFSEIFGK